MPFIILHVGQQHVCQCLKGRLVRYSIKQWSSHHTLSACTSSIPHIRQKDVFKPPQVPLQANEDTCFKWTGVWSRRKPTWVHLQRPEQLCWGSATSPSIPLKDCSFVPNALFKLKQCKVPVPFASEKAALHVFINNKCVAQRVGTKSRHKEEPGQTPWKGTRLLIWAV